jgi:hypothetical protein
VRLAGPSRTMTLRSVWNRIGPRWWARADNLGCIQETQRVLWSNSLSVRYHSPVHHWPFCPLPKSLSSVKTNTPRLLTGTKLWL